MNNDLISREAMKKLFARVKWVNKADGEAAVYLVESAPSVDAVEVVRCKDCVSHGNCLTEDTFRIARIDTPYCCGGKVTLKTQKAQYGLSGTVIKCEKCLVTLYSPDVRAVTESNILVNKPIDNHIEKAIKAWNRRADNG